MAKKRPEPRQPLDWSDCPEVIRGAGRYEDIFGVYYGIVYYGFLDSPDFPVELAHEAGVYFSNHHDQIDQFIQDHKYTNSSKYFKNHSRRCEMTIHCLALANDLNKLSSPTSEHRK